MRVDKHFKHTEYTEIFYIEDKTRLHVVDESTRYQAAKWLETVTAESTWRALRLCWVYFYIGPPEIVAHDAGKNLMEKSFQSNADLFHIETKAIPVESPN